MNNSITKKYNEALQNIPPTGQGCHPALLTAASFGVIRGLSDEQIFIDIRNNIPSVGSREVSDNEITKTIETARRDIRPNNTDRRLYTPRRRKPEPQPATREYIINLAKDYEPADLWELSPYRLTDEPKDDWKLLVRTLFKPEEYIFIGCQYASRPRKVAEILTTDKPAGEFFCINPLIPNGKRNDKSVAEYRYCLAEFDTIDLEEQAKFWLRIPLPIAAIIYSGNKSLHCIIKLPEGISDWQQVKSIIYGRILIPVGADGATSNPSRLARIPSHYRHRTRNWQSLLYLNPSPKPQSILEQIQRNDLTV